MLTWVNLTVLLTAGLTTYSFFAHGRSLSGSFSPETTYQVCFTPGNNCIDPIVSTIGSAQKSVLVQAYNFTSPLIAKALVMAKQRGVSVKVILDKSCFQKRYTIVTYLTNNQIPVWKDYKPAIAHNKVMVIDGKTVITGSFNFTNSAQKRNAENLLIINSPQLAKLYTANWESRLAVSQKMN